MGDQADQPKTTHDVRDHIGWGCFQSCAEFVTLERAIQRACIGVRFHGVFAAVVGDQPLDVSAGADALVVERDLQPLKTVVVVSEERHLETTVVEESAVVALWTQCRVCDDLDAVVEHVDTVRRENVRVLEVDARYLGVLVRLS